MQTPHKFIATLRLRCFHQARLPGHAFCGRLAVVMRIGNHTELPGYFCAKHAKPGDRKLPATGSIRRVRVTLQVELNGVTWSSSQAQQEAVDRLDGAVRAIGGALNLLEVSSQIGQTVTGARPDGTTASPNDPPVGC